MAVLVSGRALADALGVSETAVRKAAKAGRIPRAVEGKYDLDACRKAWAGNTDPARTKVRAPAHREGAQCGPSGPQSAPEGPHAEVRTADDARAAVALIAAVLKAEGADAATIDFNAARTAETIIRAHARKLALDLRRGELVGVEEVGHEVERDYAAVRSRLMAIPGRLAAKLVGLPVTAIRLAIEAEVDEALTELHAPATAERAAAETRRAGITNR